MSHYSILSSILDSISCSPSMHLRTELMTESPSLFCSYLLVNCWQNGEDSSPICNPTMSLALRSSFMSSSPWITGTAGGASLSLEILLTYTQAHSGSHTYTEVSWRCDGQLNQCKPKLVSDWKRSASIFSPLRKSKYKFWKLFVVGKSQQNWVGCSSLLMS